MDSKAKLDLFLVSKMKTKINFVPDQPFNLISGALPSMTFYLDSKTSNYVWSLAFLKTRSPSTGEKCSIKTRLDSSRCKKSARCGDLICGKQETGRWSLKEDDAWLSDIYFSRFFHTPPSSYVISGLVSRVNGASFFLF